MKFKTTPPTLHEVLVMEAIGSSMRQRMPDYSSIAQFILLRADEFVDLEELLTMQLDQIVVLFGEAMRSSLPENHKGKNNIDNVALSDEEKAKLSAIMEQMRGRQGDPR